MRQLIAEELQTIIANDDIGPPGHVTANVTQCGLKGVKVETPWAGDGSSEQIERCFPCLSGIYVFEVLNSDHSKETEFRAAAKKLFGSIKMSPPALKDL